MDKSEKSSRPDSGKSSRVRFWRLAKDLIITPVEELPENIIKQILPNGQSPKGRFGVQRERARTFPKLVNKDVVAVLEAFGEDGATYEQVLSHFVEMRSLERDRLDVDLRRLVRTLIKSSFLVDGTDESSESAESIQPSFDRGDEWLHYRIVENVHCIIDSEIYKVRDLRNGEFRALKIMQSVFPNREMKESIARRLEHEFNVMDQIGHPNVVRLREHGSHDGLVFGIMDWVDGPPVRKYIHESGVQPDDRKLIGLAIECLQALGAVHEAGYLHGDVHTGNFLVRNGHICLIDFGLSRPIDVKEGDEFRYPEGGVVNYMPPEHVRKAFNGKPGFWNSVSGEIYSCGVILFSLFTGRYPYRWKLYRREYMNSILNDPPLGFEECDRAPRPELEDVLQRALSKKPEDRFASVAEFIEALKRIPVARARVLEQPGSGGTDSKSETAG